MRNPVPVQASKAGQVPRVIAEAAYRDYKRRYGTQQSLDRMIERGGFSWAELVAFLYCELSGESPPFDDLAKEGRP